MLGSLHMLGAGNGLKGQFVVIRVDRIDGPTLKRKLAESGQNSAIIAPIADLAVNDAPPEVLNLAMGVMSEKLKEYGVYSNIKTVSAPPTSTDNKSSLLFPGMAIGGVLTLIVGAILGGIGFGTWKLGKVLV